MAYDVIIVGAGIIGCACARECARAGLRIAVIECGVPGGATTAAGMGHIVMMDDSPAQLALTGYSRSLWQDAILELPRESEYETRGTLWVAADEDEMAEVYAKEATHNGAASPVEVLSSGQLAAEEPNLRAGLAGALLVQGDGVVYPPAAAAFFLQQARDRGALLFRDQPVIAASHGAVKLANGVELQSQAIVIATGTDTSLLPWLPIQKRKGHLLITDRYPDFVHHQIVELGYLKSAHKVAADSVAFNVQPRRTGQILIGSSRQYGNDNPAIDDGILHRMLARACSYMPGLAQLAAIRAWTGFRASTPDKLPLIGPTEDPTLFVSAGFEGLGITDALGAARLLVDHILRRPSAIAAEPFLLSRSSLTEFSRA